MATDTAKAEIEIATPLKTVFYFAANLRNLHLWGEVVEIKIVDEKPGRVGSEYIGVKKSFFSKSEVPLKVIAFKSPTNFTFRDMTKSSDYVLMFIPTEKGTRVILKNRVESYSLALSNRTLKRLLTNLKNYFERVEDQPSKQV